MSATAASVRVVIPSHLRRLAGLSGEARVDVVGPVTLAAVLDALEAAYPMLLGTIRDRRSGQRRPFIRYFACELDLSNDAPETPLPSQVATGGEPLLVVGAMAGG